jgi:hypothetical protein
MRVLGGGAKEEGAEEQVLHLDTRRRGYMSNGVTTNSSN